MNRALFLTSFLFVAGCASTPASTAARLVDAAKQGDAGTFRSELTDEARAKFGAGEQMAAIRQKLARYSRVAVGPAFLVAAKQGDRGGGDIGDVKRTYKVTVAGVSHRGRPPEAIYELLLRCELSNETVHYDATPESCTTTIDENGIPWPNCTPGSPASDGVVLMESCKVGGIDEVGDAGMD
ncbi:MAG TPA: hypothetical protein VJZ76_21305 [Thermoanaerobaculia bacterium]|nr:hypothetical protein [Thermoanaerobaculia bacterium]